MVTVTKSKTVKKSTKSAAQKAVIGHEISKRTKKTAQETAANAVNTALAAVSRVVIVNFPSSNQGYAYHTRDDSIGVGDYCLVISPYADRSPAGSWRFDALNGHLTIVKVVDIKETTHSINAASKWILGKIDLSLALAEAERRQKIEVLQAKITKARKEAEARIKLEQLREYSPELDALITEMDELSGR
jgi:hypothetical protein